MCDNYTNYFIIDYKLYCLYNTPVRTKYSKDQRSCTMYMTCKLIIYKFTRATTIVV